MCGIVVSAYVMFALWLLALSYARLSLRFLSYVLFCLRFLLVRSLLSPLSPSLSPMSSGVVRALVVLFCRLLSSASRCAPSISGHDRVALAHTCSPPLPRCSILQEQLSGLVVSRLSSGVSRLVRVLPHLSRLVLPRCILALHALPRAQSL